MIPHTEPDADVEYGEHDRGCADVVVAPVGQRGDGADRAPVAATIGPSSSTQACSPDERRLSVR